MSRENVELVRRSLEAYQRGDVDAALADTHPDIHWSPYEVAPMRGVDALRAYMKSWEDEWDELETIPEEFVDADDRVLVVMHFRGRGRGSGAEVEARSYCVYTVRDGQTVRMEEFLDREEALEVAGVRE